MPISLGYLALVLNCRVLYNATSNDLNFISIWFSHDIFKNPSTVLYKQVLRYCSETLQIHEMLLALLAVLIKVFSTIYGSCSHNLFIENSDLCRHSSNFQHEVNKENLGNKLCLKLKYNLTVS